MFPASQWVLGLRPDCTTVLKEIETMTRTLSTLNTLLADNKGDGVVVV